MKQDKRRGLTRIALALALAGLLCGTCGAG